MGDDDLLSATGLVNERWDVTSTILGADGGVSIYEKAVAYLEEVYATLEDKIANMPTVDVTYPTHDIVLDEINNLTSMRPEPPTDAELTPATVEYPAMRRPLEDITVPDILALPDTIPELSDSLSLSWQEADYVSTLRDAVKTSLESWITNGGTGLGTIVEAAIWANDLDRVSDQHERDFDEASNFFASLGWTRPQGAHTALIATLQSEHTRNLTYRSNEVAIEQARLAQNNTQFAHTTSVQYEEFLMKHSDVIQDRAFQLAKDKIAMPVEIYNSKVEAYKNRVLASSASADAAKVTVEAYASLNRDTAMIYDADIKAYAARVAAEIDIVSTVAKVFESRMRGYEADARAAEVELNARIEQYKMLVTQSANETALELKEAEILLANWMSLTQLAVTTKSEIMRICAQIVASALGSISASASIGYSSSKADHTRRTDPEIQESVRTTHQYNHTA